MSSVSMVSLLATGAPSRRTSGPPCAAPTTTAAPRGAAAFGGGGGRAGRRLARAPGRGLLGRGDLRRAGGHDVLGRSARRGRRVRRGQRQGGLAGRSGRGLDTKGSDGSYDGPISTHGGGWTRVRARTARPTGGGGAGNGPGALEGVDQGGGRRLAVLRLHVLSGRRGRRGRRAGRRRQGSGDCRLRPCHRPSSLRRRRRHGEVPVAGGDARVEGRRWWRSGTRGCSASILSGQPVLWEHAHEGGRSPSARSASWRCPPATVDFS